jgi:Fur family ferric uptake transcriptional regulator
VTVEDLYQIVQKKEPGIGQVTVFRTLKILADAGIANPVRFGDKTIRYELAHGSEHHDHLVCTSCGSVIEVFDENLEAIQDKLCKKHRFKPLKHRLEIFGTCKKCR